MRAELSGLIRETPHSMRMALVLLVFCGIAGVGLFLGGAAFERHHRERHAQAERQLDVARRNHLLASARQQDIDRYLAAYRSLLADMPIGAERRLDWIDALSRGREQRKLFPVEYDIASRRPYAMADLPAANALKIFASRMSIKFPLLHEGDLFALLGDLRARKAGLFVLDSCDITRNPQEESEPIQPARNLLAECAVDWLTVENAGPSPMPASHGGPMESGSWPAIQLGFYATGRFFFTHRERAALDRLRRNGGSGATPAEITLDGLVRRSNGKTTIWVNRLPRHGSEPLHAGGVPGTTSQSAPVPLLSGRKIELKAGQTYNPASGKIREGRADAAAPRTIPQMAE